MEKTTKDFFTETPRTTISPILCDPVFSRSIFHLAHLPLIPGVDRVSNLESLQSAIEFLAVEYRVQDFVVRFCGAARPGIISLPFPLSTAVYDDQKKYICLDAMVGMKPVAPSDNLKASDLFRCLSSGAVVEIVLDNVIAKVKVKSYIQEKDRSWQFISAKQKLFNSDQRRYAPVSSECQKPMRDELANATAKIAIELVKQHRFGAFTTEYLLYSDSGKEKYCPIEIKN